MKRAFALLFLLLALTASAAQAKEYLDNFEPSKPGVFRNVFGVGADGGWTCELGQGWYGMGNTGRQGAVRYYHINAIKGETSQTLANAIVSVRVGGEFGAPVSGAGLIYRYDPNAGTYWALVVNGGGTYAVYKRGATGLGRVMGGSHSAIRKDGPNLLSIVPGLGGEVAFAINGQQMGSVSSGEITGHGAGVLAISPGRFRFQDFKLVTTTP